MHVYTENGSVYTVDLEAKTIVRSSMVHELRRDDEPLSYLGFQDLAVGESWTIFLEPLGEGDVTVRVTSKVVRIEE